jgi:hypothetical protein
VSVDPLALAAVHDTTACPLLATALTPVGAVGTPAGVTAFDAADAVPNPSALLARTVNAYEVPFVSPVTTADS